jgi:ribulose-5-phosphate 4-epimerase/fuculose-1-phosphate aldolase
LYFDGFSEKVGATRFHRTLERDVVDAYNKMEKLEHTARVVLAARLQGPLPPLSAEEVEKLRQIAAKHKGWGDFS